MPVQIFRSYTDSAIYTKPEYNANAIHIPQDYGRRSKLQPKEVHILWFFIVTPSKIERKTNIIQIFSHFYIHFIQIKIWMTENKRKSCTSERYWLDGRVYTKGKSVLKPVFQPFCTFLFVSEWQVLKMNWNRMCQNESSPSLSLPWLYCDALSDWKINFSRFQCSHSRNILIGAGRRVE